jgi:hypothetical protein
MLASLCDSYHMIKDIKLEDNLSALAKIDENNIV